MQLKSDYAKQSVLKYYENELKQDNYIYLDSDCCLDKYILNNMSDDLFNYVFKQKNIYLDNIEYDVLLNMLLEVNNTDRKIYLLYHFVCNYYEEDINFTDNFINTLNKVYEYKNDIWKLLVKSDYLRFIYLFQHQIKDKEFYLDAFINENIKLNDLSLNIYDKDNIELDFIKSFFKDEKKLNNFLFVLNLGGN